MLVHSVYFYLKPELTPAQRDDFRRQVTTLGSISDLEAFYVGTPAPVPPRPVIQTGYDVSITGVFKDVAAHDAYQVDPIHTAFVKNGQPYWSRVEVYDSQG